MPCMTDEELGYIAGIIDGEGHICWLKRDRNVRIGVTSTTPALLEWLVERMGGFIHEKRGSRLGTKVVCDWTNQRGACGDRPARDQGAADCQARGRGSCAGDVGGKGDRLRAAASALREHRASARGDGGAWMERLTPRFVAGLLTHYAATAKHKLWVAWFLLRWCQRNGEWLEFARRALVHDLSKFRWDESAGFAQTIFDLKHAEYGTPEYSALLEAIYPSILLHYERNRHHPEHWPGGFGDMTDHDRIEMVADWCAASRRGRNGNVARSIATNAGRFGYGEVERLALVVVAQEMRAL